MCHRPDDETTCYSGHFCREFNSSQYVVNLDYLCISGIAISKSLYKYILF